VEYLIGGGILGICLGLFYINMKSNGKFQEEADRKYVFREMCTVLHKQVSEDLTEIKADVKELLKQNGKNRN